jgi:hypothetical protein
MLSCIIDGQPAAIQYEAMSTLAGLLDDLNITLAKERKFIASLHVDGKDMGGTATCVDRRLDGIGTIAITTESSFSLAGRILDEAQNYIDGLMDFLRQVAGHYGAGSNCAEGAFEEAVQGLQWFVQMTDFCETTLGLDFTILSCNGGSVSQSVETLNGILSDLADAQEANDPVMLADIMEYDLVPHLAEWKEIYLLIQEKFRSMG